MFFYGIYGLEILETCQPARALQFVPFMNLGEGGPSLTNTGRTDGTSHVSCLPGGQSVTATRQKHLQLHSHNEWC